MDNMLYSFGARAIMLDESDDDDEPEVYYAQLMYLVASEAGRALRQNKESGPAVDSVGQPRAKIIAQMNMNRVMSRACRWMEHLRAGARIHGEVGEGVSHLVVGPDMVGPVPHVDAR
jgi:hypothetical protein